MSDVVLAPRYSASNYPVALNNLAQRYRRDNQPVNYKDAGFGDVSEDQANSALNFFADVGIIENPKSGNFVPSDEVLDWQLKMGEVEERAKSKVREKLLDYDVFDEINFVLDQGDGEENIDKLAEQVGGIVGIDEEELSDLKRTIRVFAECGFLEMRGDGVVGLPDEFEGTAEEDEKSTVGTPQQGSEKTSAGKRPPTSETVDTDLEKPRTGVASGWKINLEISLDATDMEPDELEKKLEIIEDSIEND